MIKLGKLLAAFVIAWTVIQPATKGSVVPEQTAVAVLKGTVLDRAGSGILLDYGYVVIENLTTKQVWKLHTDDSAVFSASLPAGTYRITSETRMYLPFRRADFHLEPGSTSMVNLVLHPEFLIRGTTVGTKRIDRSAPTPHYTSFTVPGAPSDISKGLIRHSGTSTIKGMTVYKYATLTFDLITVYADEISRDRKQLRFNASGRVIVEDGKERTSVGAAEVEFKDGKAIVKRVD